MPQNWHTALQYPADPDHTGVNTLHTAQGKALQ